MLKALVINPAPGSESHLEAALRDTGVFEVALHTGQFHPSASTLERLVRLHCPEVVFIAVDDLKEALRVAANLDEILPDLPVVAFGQDCQNETALRLMRAGIREFLEPPFTRDAILTAASRLEQYLTRHPLRVQSTDQIYSFLPARPGAGTTTVATNASFAASRYHGREVLLMDADLHNGLVAFMLSLKPPHGLADALEQSAALDEALWPQLVAAKEGLDILASTTVPTGYQIDCAALENVIRVARRCYRIVFVDLPGNTEPSSVQLMQESKQIFLVATPEIAVLHLARKKLEELARLDLHDRVRLILNRWPASTLIGRPQIEDMLGIPIHHTIANEYQAIYRTQLAGQAIIRNSKLGVQIDNLARDILGLEASDDAGGGRFLFRYATRVTDWWRGKTARWSEKAPKKGDGLPPLDRIVRPEAARRAPSRTSRIPEVNPLSNEQVSDLLAACDAFGDAGESEQQDLSVTLRALVLVLRHSGLRLQDAVMLSRDQLASNHLLLSKGNTADPVWNLLPDAVCEALDRCPKNGTNRFFPDDSGGSQKALQFWRSHLDKLFELAGLSDRGAIRLRDTYAVELLEAGTPVETVSAYLGHKNPTATRRRYSRWISGRPGNTAPEEREPQTLDADQGQTAALEEATPDQSGTTSLQRLASAVHATRKALVD